MKKIVLFLIMILSIQVVSAQLLSEQDQYKIGSHTVTVVDVNNAETKCGVSVDGEVQWIDEKSDAYFGNVYIYVKDVIAVNTQAEDRDTCELLITISNKNTGLVANPADDEPKEYVDLPEIVDDEDEIVVMQEEEKEDIEEQPEPTIEVVKTEEKEPTLPPVEEVQEEPKPGFFQSIISFFRSLFA